LIEAGQQKVLQAQFRQQSIHRVIKSIDKTQIEQEKVDRFINRAKYWQIYLDQEMNSWIDQVRYKDRKERYDVCKKDKTETEAL
jgi:hypothetical protein